MGIITTRLVVVIHAVSLISSVYSRCREWSRMLQHPTNQLHKSIPQLFLGSKPELFQTTEWCVSDRCILPYAPGAISRNPTSQKDSSRAKYAYNRPVCAPA